MFSPGDVLLYKAQAWKFSNALAKCIQIITGNQIIHVALYLNGHGDDHFILEALSDGVYIKHVTTQEIYHHNRDFELVGIASLPYTFTNLLTCAEKYNDKKYGFLTILNLLLQHGMGRLAQPWKIWFQSKDAYICSQVTQLVLQDAIKNIEFPKPAAITEPDDYAVFPWKVNVDISL